MDGQRFDALARAMARGRSRRDFLKALAGGTMGGVAALFAGSALADPSCRDAGHPCEGNQDCCDGLICVASGPGAALRCTDCPAGMIPCANSCIPACAASDACHAVGICDPGSGQCTNPVLPDNMSCGDGQGCCAGLCTDFSTTANCGACGTACTTNVANASPVCTSGNCDFACDDGYHRCAGACVSDDSVTQCGASCGDCTANAPANTVPTCSNGACSYPCDTAHGASACGTACCPSGQTCCNGVCKQAAGSTCGGDGDCCSGICVRGVCNVTCSEEGAACSDTADCCGGSPCVAGSGICCTTGVACGTSCCPTAQDICVSGACCTPESQAAACNGANCGTVTNNCGQIVTCGTCSGSDTCGGGGTPGICGCIPQCSAETNPCGPDSCGGFCNACPAGLGCGDYQCICSTEYVICDAAATFPGVPCCASDGLICGPLGFCCMPGSQETTCAGKCGTVNDNCGTGYDCGGCTTPFVCSSDNICACNTDCSVENTCGSDGCGGVCGPCPTNQGCVINQENGHGICSCVIRGIACNAATGLASNGIPCCNGCGSNNQCL